MLSLAVLTLAAAPAPATWYVVSETPSALVAIDMASVHRKGQIAYVNEAQVFKKILDTEYGPVRRIDQELLVNCQDHSITSQNLSLRKISGEVAVTTEPSDKRPFKSEAINNLVCLGSPSQPLTGPLHIETIIRSVGG